MDFGSSVFAFINSAIKLRNFGIMESSKLMYGYICSMNETKM